MVVKKLFCFGMLLSLIGCGSNRGDADGGAKVSGGVGGDANSDIVSSSGSKSSSNTQTSSKASTDADSETSASGGSGAGSKTGTKPKATGGNSGNSNTDPDSTSGDQCAFTCQDHCSSVGGTLKEGTCPNSQKCCDTGDSDPGAGGGSGSGGSTGTGTSSAGGNTATGGTSSTGNDTGTEPEVNSGPCEYECTDFCLNNGGTKMSGTCSKSGDVCCNFEADVTTATGKEFFIDAAGNDSNDGTSPDKAWKSLTKIKDAGTGAVVNLKRGSVWETKGAINVTNQTLRPYGKGPRPIVHGKSIIVPQSLGTIVLKGKAVLDGVKVTSDQGFGAYIYGDDNVIRNVEVDGSDTGALMGIGIVGNNNEVTNCYVHDLTTDTGDTGDVNSSGGAEGIVVFGGSHINVGHNTVARAHCKNETLGGDEGGCTEIIMNPLFFNTYGEVVEDVQFHHNLCVDTVGLFESCQGTGEVGFDPTKNPGTIRDITVAYNVVLDSKWMYLAQIVNTIHEKVVFEHNTIIHGPRNDTQWADNAMSHEYMFGMVFSASNNTSVSDSLSADQILVRNNMFWEPFTKEAVMIGVTSGHSNNLFGPSTITLEKRWTLAATEKKVDDLGLVDVFHPTSDSPAVDKGLAGGVFDKDFYGNGTCGSAPDIGAVEYCEDDPAKAKSQEIVKYLELNQ